MRKPKTLEFNLATMTPDKLIKMLESNQAQLGELIALLGALFEMFSSSLRFSEAVFKYGEEHHDRFIEEFIAVSAEQHGINPQQLLDLVATVRQSPSAAIH